MNEPIQSPPAPDTIAADEVEKPAADQGGAESVATESDAAASETKPSRDAPPDGEAPKGRLSVWDLFPHANKDPEVDAAYRRFRAELEAKARQAEQQREVGPTFNDAPEAFITRDEGEIIAPPELRHAPPETREEAVLLLGRVAGQCEAGIENLATALWPGFHLAERQKSMAVAACLTNALANIVRTMNQIGGTRHSMLVEKIERTLAQAETDNA